MGQNREERDEEPFYFNRWSMDSGWMCREGGWVDKFVKMDKFDQNSKLQIHELAYYNIDVEKFLYFWET